ncbi:MAG: hypothetical protein HY862_03835 [Chloroflexi bacterium]|nr:hypothetical protein [Chloroflexota bacterium]
MTLQNRTELRSFSFGLTLPQMESAVELIDLQPCQNAFIKATYQQLLVIDGVAWLSMDGEDVVIKAGESCILTSNKHRHPICMSALGGKPVTYALK